LDITIQTLIATDGSLWIKTDGNAGGAGGEGGDGAEGARPNTGGAQCYDAGRVVMVAAEETEAMVATPPK
jgi:hypothetical protein